MRYKDIFKTWGHDNDWYRFSIGFLTDLGYCLEEKFHGGAIMEYNKIKYFVSMQHNINEGSIGVSDEKDILARIKKHNVDGFVGFYSGNYSTALLSRLNGMNVNFLLFNGSKISTLLVFCHSDLIDEFFNKEITIGIKNSIWRYYKHTGEHTYTPLLCMCGCGMDILDVRCIGLSMATVYHDRKNKKLFFIYGNKSHIGHFENTSCGWVEINQVLHSDQANEWNSILDEYVNNNSGLDISKFYQYKYIFLSGILQRLRPANAGLFLRLG